MCKETVKKIYDISKEYDAKKLKVITNHIKICGELCECGMDNETLITLQNAKIWLIDDLCKCGAEDCNCTTPHVIKLEWLHVNTDKIVAFSLLK